MVYRQVGAAFCCAKLGITNEPRLDHAQYLKCWLQLFNDDKRAIFKA
jgi:antirestriction protein ArdC